MLYHLQGNYHAAVNAFEQAIEILENLPQSERYILETLSDCYYHIGVMKLIQNDPDEGQKRLQKAYEINSANDDFQGQEMVCHAMAHFGLNNLPQ
jgi:tetratricopeptide (TPR) repeat protein